MIDSSLYAPSHQFTQSAGAVKYTKCTSTERSPLPTTLNNLELWGMRGTYSLPSLPGPFWLGVIGTDRVLSVG